MLTRPRKTWRSPDASPPDVLLRKRTAFIPNIKNQISPEITWTFAEATGALSGPHTYTPASDARALCTSSRLVLWAPFSVTSDMPPRAESKFITSRRMIVLGGSGVCLTVHVKLMVDPAWMNSSAPPAMTVSGSEKINIGTGSETRAAPELGAGVSAGRIKK
ncbi:hypothetical protein EVAR_30602_1 [Eumeta japonica]|uniref:Uncharacterized protein n=1 Tax=Eumeta variegata TaxID=151549 RepID=A0A4C1WBI3_EUMVA|nr:hypothetical protein EVAR_30602_1 [Eumeta japonica]